MELIKENSHSYLGGEGAKQLEYCTIIYINIISYFQVCFTWIKVVLEPAFARKPDLEIWKSTFQL